jgi:hypothetical protein
VGLVVLVIITELLALTLFYSLQVQAHTQGILLQRAVVMVENKALAVEAVEVVALLVGQIQP